MTLVLKESRYLRFNPNTLEEIRKEYGFSQQGMARAVDILEEWIQKQEHFLKKNYSREYLERLIISTKGSVEKAKVRIDRLCTLRSLVPQLFEKTNVKKDLPTLSNSYINLNMPTLTEDNYRIFVIQLKGDMTSSTLLQGYQYSIVGGEYIGRNDYTLGAHVILDVLNTNIMNLVTNANLIDLRNAATSQIEGFGFRIKGIYVLSASKVVDTLVSILKQVISVKVLGRIKVLKNAEDLLEYIPKRLLPEDYGGDQKSIAELFDMWTEELSSEEHVNYMEEMRKACTDESLRRSAQFNDEYLGMPGSFKILSVD